MKTIREIKASPNFSKRTFTLRVYWDKKLSSKYRTVKMSKEDFENELNNTNNDWDYFMRSNNYYLVKNY